MREELDKYFARVRQHDPKSLEFVLMVTGHGEANGGTRMCSMIGGPPQTIAHVVTELVKHNPAFAAFLQHMRNTDGADVEAQVKDLIGSVH